MAGNSNLQDSRKQKADEFYTPLSMIENELKHYREHFKGKTVLCNCDDPRVSNFFRYFVIYFEVLGIKKVIATCYKNNNADLFSQETTEKAVCLEYEGNPKYTSESDFARIPCRELKGNGDFRSEECVEFLKEADIVSVDVGAEWGGFTGDCAATFACGKISPTAQKLITVTEQSFYEGIKFARQGCRISDIGHAVQTYVESHGFGVVRAFVGHGVGEVLHEEPSIPNYGAPGRGPRMVKGMTLAIEPMVTEGTYDVRVLRDKWTTVTADGKLAAHYENTILVTDGEPEILTVT